MLCADIHHSTILIKSYNITTVSYINKQCGCRSSILSNITRDILPWIIPKFIRLVVPHMTGKENVDADLL